MKCRQTIIWVVILAAVLAAAPAQARRSVQDQLGRTVSVPEHPQRVIALAPSITEIIFALDRQSCLAGITRYSDYPPETAGIPRVGVYVQPDLEKILALNPDLCIAIKDGNPEQVAKRLEGLNVPVYAVDPRNLDGVMQTIGEIGDLLGARKQAEALVGRMRSRIDFVRARVAEAATRPRVFFQIGISPIVSAGTDTFANEIIELAGGENLAKGETAYPRYSREQLLALSPDVIVITSMDRGGVFEAARAELEKWTQIPAARNHRIHLVDSNIFDRPTPRLVEALELMARLIHPEQFEAAP